MVEGHVLHLEGDADNVVALANQRLVEVISSVTAWVLACTAG